MSKVVKGIVGAVITVVGFVVPGAQFLIPLGLSLVGGALMEAVAGSGQKNRAASSATMQVGESPRRAVFGRSAESGGLVDAFNYGGKYGTDWEVLVIDLAAHRCDALEGFYVNEDYVAFAGDGAVAGYNGQLEVYWRPGTETQAVPQILLDHGPGWTANDRGRGIAYVVVAYKADDSDAKNPVWTAGRPRFRWVLRGLRCYQARKDSTVGGTGAHRWANPATWEWTENPIDIRYNWVRGIFACDRIDQPDQLLVGRGLSAIEAPPANVFARANLCDEQVGGMARYRLGGSVEASETYSAVESDIAAACAGVIVQPEGAVEIDPGEAKAPIAHFTDDDLIVGSKVRWSKILGSGDAGWVNSVVASFIDPAQKWAERSAPVRRDLADIQADGKPREQRLRLSLVSWREQAERVAEIVRRFGRLWARGEVTLPPRFAFIEEGDWVTWQSARRFGGETRTFRVESWSSDQAWHHKIALRQISASVFSDTAPLDDGVVTQQQPAPPAIAAPDAGAWALAAGVLSGGGVQTPALIVTGAIDDPAAVLIRLEYFQGAGPPGGATVWTEVGLFGPELVRREIPVAAGGTYWVAVSYVVDGVTSNRLALGPVTLGNVTYPGGTPIVPPQLGVNITDESGELLTDVDVVTAEGAAGGLIGAGAGAYANSLIELNATEGQKFASIDEGVRRDGQLLPNGDLAEPPSNMFFFQNRTARITAPAGSPAATVLQFQSGGNAQMYFGYGVSSSLSNTNGLVPIAPGDRLWLTLLARTIVGSGLCMRMDLPIYDGSKAYVGTSVVSSQAAPPTADFGFVTVVIDIPATIGSPTAKVPAFCKMSMEKLGSAIEVLVAGAWLTKVQRGSTRNNLTRAAVAPTVVADGDIWVDTSVTPNLVKMRVGGAWQISANYSTNTNQLVDGANLGGTATWTGVSGSGKPADNATKNIVSHAASAPASPVNGDIWVDTSVTPNLVKMRVSGAWQISANYSTNTNQLVDGANLGGTATWTGVSGSGKPADNATKNIVSHAASAPASPVDGDIWVDTSVTPNLVKVRVSGAWQISANYSTNTNQLIDGANLGGTATWTGVSGTGKPADNATKNIVSYAASAPASPVDGDIWVDTSVTPNLVKVRVSGAWQISANYSTNTNQLVDGANLGGTASWAGVSGSGKPADNATKNTVTRSASEPGSPTNGDVWVDISVTPNLVKVRVSGAWQASANYSTNTNQLVDGANLGGTASWAGVSGTGKPADNATKNIVSYAASAPASPVDGDIWVDTSVTPNLVKMRVSGAWQISANYSTNTNQLVDGANLGGTASWAGVSGTGKPQDNADVTANAQITFTDPAPFVVQANSESVTTSDLTTITRSIKVLKGGVEQTSGVTVGTPVGNPSGSITATASVSAGIVTVTLTLANAGGSVKVPVIFGGVTYERTIVVTRNVAVPVMGGSSGSSSFVDATWFNCDSTYVQVTDSGAQVETNPSGQLRFSASASYAIATRQIKAQYSANGSSWTDVPGSETTGSAPITVPGEEEPGAVSFAPITVSGLAASTNYYVRLLARRTSGSGSVTWESPTFSVVKP